jgi:hypothetical protein
VIGVHAHDALADLLEKVVAGEKAGGRAIEVRRLRGPEDAPGCQLAYLPGEAPWAALRAGAVLTVGETEEFWRGGGVIRFVFLRNRVRLHINLDAAREQGLSLTSKLLRIAERVEGAR